MRGALRWSGGIVALARVVGVFLLVRDGTKSALEFYAGYLIELSLSVDNLFVFILVFQYFGVPPELQPRVLKWGILGAIVMRLIMILAGALLLERFHWIIYIFGGILIYTGFHMFSSKEERIEPERNPIVRLARKVLPFTDTYSGQHFFVRSLRGTLMATPLLLVLLVIEWTDLVFAIDSIPAVFAVTRDPFIVYTSNIFAILGLRALFFVLAGKMHTFEYLKPRIVTILVFVGIKMAISYWVHIPILISLAVIVGVLTLATVASLVKLRRLDGAGGR